MIMANSSAYHSPLKAIDFSLLLHPLFIISVTLFCIHQVLEKLLGIHIIYLDNYLDPMLCMPIILTLLTLQKQYIFQDRKSRLSLFTIICSTAIVIIISEWLFPILSFRFTADPLDALFFIVGAILFIILINRHR